MAYQITNGRQLYFEEHGSRDGHPVVLLHHGLGSTRAWRAQIPALVEAGFRVIAYDRWGYGGSDPRPGLDIPLFQADRQDLLALLDGLGVERAALVGHSDGGTLALYFAADQPRRVTSLVVVAAHIYIEPKMQTGINAVRRAFEADERFHEGLQRVHGENTLAVFDGWFYGWLRPENLSWDLRPVLSRVTCPVLVVQGMEDEHAVPQHAQDLAAALPRSSLWLEPGVNHMLPQEKPAAFNRRVVEFLRS